MDRMEFNHIRQYRLPGVISPLPVISEVLARDGEGRPTYIGYALQGSVTSAAEWMVERITYDSNGWEQRNRYSPMNSIADNYASLTYS